MAYYFYLDKLLLPIAPSKMDLKINNQNETATLINEGEVNILKKAGLTDIEFEALIPSVEYPFATYKNGFKKASYFLNEIEKLKINKRPFQFIVTRTMPNGEMLFDTNMRVSLEEYSIEENAGEGFDLIVSISLKQYRDYGTKTVKIKKPSSQNTNKKTKAIVEKKRPSNPKKIVIGSNVIVNGRLHRDSYGKGPGQMRTNYRGKVNFINKKGSHPYHITTPAGAWQGWVTASSVKGV